MTEIKKFKILSIDGGGIRGVIPTQILCQLEEKAIEKDGPNARLCDYFDLICGTSTGGIIAIGLALGMKASEIANLYMEHANLIFPSSSLWKKIDKLLRCKPFYGTNELKDLLSQHYNACTNGKEARIDDCKTRICIPSFNLSKGENNVYKTKHLPNYCSDYQIKAVDVALSTAAAPVYFKPYCYNFESEKSSNKVAVNNCVDGGIYANNPSLIGLFEAHILIGIPLENIELLSLGTGFHEFSDHSKNKKMGPLYWLNLLSKKSFRLYDLMSTAQSNYINNLVKLMCKGNGNSHDQRFKYVRLQATLNENIQLDTTEKESLEYLQQLGASEFKENYVKLLPFIEQKITPYK